MKGQIKSAATWKNGEDQAVPVFEFEKREAGKNDPANTFTAVIVKDVERFFDESEDLFNQTFQILEFILRTKTAIGFLKPCFGEGGLNIDVHLELTNSEGKTFANKIQPTYLLPEESISKARILDLDEFKKLAVTYDDRQKAAKLQGKCLRKIGSVNRAGRKINYYCFFVPRRALWTEISEKRGLVIDQLGGEKLYLYEGGIYTASRGMPSGIRLEPPRTGYAGTWPQFYLILEDDAIVFDLGRKSIPGRTAGLLREIASGLFNEFRPFFDYVSSDPPVIGLVAGLQQYEKSKLFEELQKLPDLNVKGVAYLKQPDSQEAAVVAIFHELVAANVLLGYETLKMGYKMTYDLWGMYRVEKEKISNKFWRLGHGPTIELPIVIEFKFRAENILEDFEENRKFFTDIDLIVCWDLDEKVLGKNNVTVEVLRDEDVFFHGSNFELVWPGSYNLGNASKKPVIALRKLVQDLQAKG